jgi:hypothetical protein
MLKIAPLARWLLLAILVAVCVPIATDMFVRWYDRPLAAGGWVITNLLAAGQSPWLFPAALVIAGLTAGTWIDWLFRRLDSSRAAARVEVGNELLRLAAKVAARQEGVRNEWPANVHDLRPSIMSAFIRVEQLGIWAPVDQPYGLLDGAKVLVNYLQLVGTMLADGHFRQARKRASQFRAFLEAGTNS